MWNINSYEVENSKVNNLPDEKLFFWIVNKIKQITQEILFYYKDNLDKKTKRKLKLIESEKTEKDILFILQKLEKYWNIDINSEEYLNLHKYLKEWLLYINDIRESIIIFVKKQLGELCKQIIYKWDNFLPDSDLSESEKCLFVYWLRKNYISNDYLILINTIFLKKWIELNYYNNDFIKEHYVLNLMFKLWLEYDEIKAYNYNKENIRW